MSTTTPTQRFTTTVLALFIGLALILAGCSSSGAEAGNADTGSETRDDGHTGDSGDVGPPDDDVFVGPPIRVDDDAVGVGVEADDVVSGVLDRLDIDGDDGEDLRVEIAKAILPAGVDVNDPVALLDALAGRLGPEYADVTDIDVLLDALITELEADGDIGSVDELLTSIAEWAGDGVITIGSGSGGPTIGLDTSFDEAMALTETPGVTIDVLAGLVPFELRDVDITVDQAARRISVQGWLPAPISGAATLNVTWTADGPQLSVDVTRDSLTMADLVPGVNLGSVGSIGASDVTLRVDADGISAAASMVPGDLPGLGALGLTGVAIPVDFASAGFGPWTSAPTVAPIVIEIPLDLDPVASWNTTRDGIVRLTIANDPVIAYEESMTVDLGGRTVVFTGAGQVSGDSIAVTLTMDGDWVAPFGLDWLTLSDVTLTIDRNGADTEAGISGRYNLGGKSGTLTFDVNNSGDASVTGTLDDLVAADLDRVARSLVGTNLLPGGVRLPNNILALRNVTISFSTGGDGPSFAMGATTELFGQVADASFSVVPAGDGGSTTVVVVEPRDVVLGELFPVLDGNEIVGDLRLPNTAFVFAGKDVKAGSVPSLGQIRLPSGISLAGQIPGGVAPAIDDLKELLGMDPGAPLQLSGTIPVGALTGGGGDFVLDASLPAMSPGGSPEWFVSAQLGFRITSQPSVGIVGSMTLDIQGDVQTFEIEASVAKTPTGVAVEFVGRLGNPWVSPFDIEWMTLNQVVLKLGMEPGRGVTIGFLGDIVVGTKDLRGAMAITISPAGAPTNFLFEAASAEGVSLGDLADVYALMTGEARPPVERVLPAIEVRDIALRFAPQGDADLGVEQGFRLAGELWMSQGPGGRLERIVGVDLEISDRGIEADGYLTNFALGPVAFDETIVSLDVTARQQRLAFSGGVDVAGNAVDVALGVSLTEMSFVTSIDFNGSGATVEIAADYGLANPGWRARAIMNEQFIRDVDSATSLLLGSKVSDLNSQITNGERALSAAQSSLRAARSTLSAAQRAVRVTGCGWPFGYLCDRVDAAQRQVTRWSRSVSAAQTQLDRGKDLLEKYDIQLTIVGAEFEAEFSALGNNRVAMDLIVDANGVRVPVPFEWDFNQSIDANVNGLLDQIVAF